MRFTGFIAIVISSAFLALIIWHLFMYDKEKPALNLIKDFFFTWGLLVVIGTILMAAIVTLSLLRAFSFVFILIVAVVAAIMTLKN